MTTYPIYDILMPKIFQKKLLKKESLELWNLEHAASEMETKQIN